MALKIDTEFPGQSVAGDASYPQGSAQDVTTPGDGTGTPLVARLLNDFFGFFQRLLAEASITPSGNPDTVLDSDYFDALQTIFDAAGIAPSVSAIILAQRNTWTKSQVVQMVTLTDGATINTDASLSDNFTVTLGGNRTLANPTNLIAGQTLIYTIKQDATGNRTLSYGSLFKKPSGQTLTLSTAANASDALYCRYNGTILECSLQRNFG